MEMRKFLVEIKPDGRVYATEYTDAPAYPKIVRDRLWELARKYECECNCLRRCDTPVERAIAHGVEWALDELKVAIQSI